jgi:predicted AAA+ superfamily ATPase
MYIERDIRVKVDRMSQVTNIVALVGARQSGKTTLLRTLLPPGGRYVLFDDSTVRRTFEEDINGFELQHLKGNTVTILDEVQRCKDAGPTLKCLADTGNRIWITSSSEFILGLDVLSHLVGRVSILRLYPFNLREFLRAKGQKVLPAFLEEQFVREHMAYGGYPRVVLTEEPDTKEDLLLDLHRTILLRDVARGFSIRNLLDLEQLLAYLAVSPGTELAYEDTASALGMDRLTVKKYVQAMEMSSLLYMVRPFFRNKRKELKKRKRVYFLDTGLRNAIAADLKAQPTGAVFENYVLTELVKMGYKPKYWRTKTGAEVDFVVEQGLRFTPIEVKLHIDPRKVERGLRSFIDHYGPKEAFVVGLHGKTGKRRVQGCTVRFTAVSGLWSGLKGETVVPAIPGKAHRGDA